MKGGIVPIHIMRWAPADFLSDPFVMMLIGDGRYETYVFYRQFIDVSFLEGGRVRDDVRLLAALSGLSQEQAQKARNFCVEAGKLVLEDGWVYHQRVVREVERELDFRAEQSNTSRTRTALERIEQARAAGRRSAEVRASKYGSAQPFTRTTPNDPRTTPERPESRSPNDPRTTKTDETSKSATAQDISRTSGSNYRSNDPESRSGVVRDVVRRTTDRDDTVNLASEQDIVRTSTPNVHPNVPPAPAPAPSNVHPSLRDVGGSEATPSTQPVVVNAPVVEAVPQSVGRPGQLKLRGTNPRPLKTPGGWPARVVRLWAGAGTPARVGAALSQVVDRFGEERVLGDLEKWLTVPGNARFGIDGFARTVGAPEAAPQSDRSRETVASIKAEILGGMK